MQIPMWHVGEFIAGKEPFSRWRKCAAFSAALLGVLAWTAQLGAQSAAQVTLVKAGRLLDPRSGNVLAPAAILIEGGKIK